MCVYVRVYIYIYIYIYTHTHIFIHTSAQPQEPRSGGGQRPGKTSTLTLLDGQEPGGAPPLNNNHNYKTHTTNIDIHVTTITHLTIDITSTLQLLDGQEPGGAPP